MDDKAVAEISSGYPLGQNVALGGVLPDGTDSTNELSFMCLGAQAHIRLLQPNLTVRLHAGTPDDFLKAAVRVISLGSSMPQLLNDELIIPSLVQRASPSRKQGDYIPVGCDGITVDGTWGRCSGGYLNFAKVLELTLNNGRCLLTGEKLGLETGGPGRLPNLLGADGCVPSAVGACRRHPGGSRQHHRPNPAELAPCPTVSILSYGLHRKRPGCHPRGSPLQLHRTCRCGLGHRRRLPGRHQEAGLRVKGSLPRRHHPGYPAGLRRP